MSPAVKATSAVGAASVVDPAMVSAMGSVLFIDVADASALTRVWDARYEYAAGAVRLRDTSKLNSPSVAELLPLARALPSLSADTASDA